MRTRSVFKSEAARAAVLEAYESVLARWPAAALGGRSLERLRVATSAGETAVLAFGPADAGGIVAGAGPGTALGPGAGGAAGAAEGPPLILLHGTGSNSSMWLGDAAALARGRRVYAVDIPGEPGMSEDARLDWETPGPAAAWLGEVAAALGLRELAVAGLSLGGWIALAYAAGRPAGLRAVALLCPSGIGRARASFIPKAMLAMARGRRGLEGLSRSLYGDLAPPEEAIRVGTLMAMSTNARMETPRIFTDEELAGIAAPIFLAAGSEDALLRSGESAARLARLAPEAEIRLLEGAGHALVGLGEEVAGFLRRVCSA